MRKRNKLWAAIGLILCVFSCASCGEKDHNDGICDICNKKATYSGKDEEYCDKCYEKALEWYIKQALE